MYHADAIEKYHSTAYRKIHTPFLVVNGQKDSTILSADAFVKKLLTQKFLLLICA